MNTFINKNNWFLGNIWLNWSGKKFQKAGRHRPMRHGHHRSNVVKGANCFIHQVDSVRRPRVTCIWIISTSTSFQFSCSVVSDSLRHHGLQHASLPCPSPIPGIYSKSCPSTQWCHPTISSSADPFSSLVQSFPGSGSFPSGQFFAPGVQSIILTLIPSIWMCSCKNSHELFALLWPNNTPKEADLLTTSQKSVKQTFQSPRLRHMVFKISL